MELPWLKNKSKYKSNGGGVTTIEREPDNSDPDKFLDTITDELMDAWSRKDHAASREALRAFVLMLKDKDA